MRVDAILRRKDNRIIAVGMTAPVAQAARLLKAEDVGALVVKDSCATEGDVVLGMLSERDIVRGLADYGAAALRMPVSTLMSRTVVRCEPEDDADGVIELMQRHHVRHIPVLDGDALIGVVSIRDMVAGRAEPAVPA